VIFNLKRETDVGGCRNHRQLAVYVKEYRKQPTRLFHVMAIFPTWNWKAGSLNFGNGKHVWESVPHYHLG
jgi:hypothetical protein